MPQALEHRRYRLTIAAIAVILAILALALSLEIVEEVVEGSVKPVDELILALVASYRNPELTTAALVLHHMLLFPYVLLVIAPIFVYLIATRRYKMTAAVGIVMVLSMLMTIAIKDIILRPRPAIAIIPESGYSFPSGHASGAVVIYGIMAYVVWRYMVKNTVARLIIALFTTALIVATGLSRVYLLVHYPSDVAAGWAVGSVLLFGAIAVLEFVRRHQGRSMQDT